MRFEPKKVERRPFEGTRGAWVREKDFDRLWAFNKEQTVLLRDIYADRSKDGYYDELQSRTQQILAWATE